jgi:hypothetical protein
MHPRRSVVDLDSAGVALPLGNSDLPGMMLRRPAVVTDVDQLRFDRMPTSRFHWIQWS